MKSDIPHIKVAYFGHPGSFSSKAARLFLKKNNIGDYYLFPCESVAEVMDYVLVGGCYGVLPYYNNTAGKVQPSTDALANHRALVVDDFEIPVHHYLMSKSPKSKIRAIVSHPQALLQCRQYLSKNFPAVKLVEYSTTSTAAHDLAYGRLEDYCAVIASKEAAEKYNLSIVDSNIEDRRDNTTHFKVLHKQESGQ